MLNCELMLSISVIYIAREVMQTQMPVWQVPCWAVNSD